MTGQNFTCGCPIEFLHSKNFEITYILPMISTSAMKLNIKIVSDDSLINRTIATVSLAANTYEIVKILITTPRNTPNEDDQVEMKFTYGTKSYSIKGNSTQTLSLQFFSQTGKDKV